MRRETEIIAGDAADSVRRAAAVLCAGGLVGLPTETVYGLACDALNASAVARVFAVKARPSFDPLIVHVRDFAHAQTLGVFDATARSLAERFWPGPLTLVQPRRRTGPVDGTDAGSRDERFVVPDLVTAGLERVALRAPDHPVAQVVLCKSGLALAAPSANRFGSISPTAASHVLDELSGEIDLVLDGGPCRSGVESTVVAVEPATSGGPASVTVLRLGATSLEAITDALPGIAVSVAQPTSAPGRSNTSSTRDAALPSPGMTDRHYAPRTPLRWVHDFEAGMALANTGRWGLIGVGDCSPYASHFARVCSLSASGDLAQAATRLFAAMRELDALRLDGIVAVLALEEGLGRAINDRLRRAGQPG